MSRRALALAVLGQIQSAPHKHGLALTSQHSDLCPFQGQPPPRCGEVFWGVWCGARTNNSRPMGALDESYTVNITISFRLQGKTPFDRIGSQRWSAKDGDILKTGIDDAVDRTRISIMARDFDHSVIQFANTLMFPEDADVLGSGYNSRSFCEPLRYLGDDEIQPVGPEWFSSRGEERRYGAIVTLRFGGARRIQKFAAPDDEEPT